MELHYEKHQRDYTVLGTFVTIGEFFGKSMRVFFAYDAHPLYVYLKNNIFYHFLPKEDYAGWAQAYFKKYSESDFVEYAQKTNKDLEKYWIFFKKENHESKIEALEILHKYMQNFLSIIMISVYSPENIKLSKKIYDLCIETREKYEDVHKFGMELQKTLLNQLEDELEIKKDTLQYLTYLEYKNFLSTKELPENIEARKNFFFVECSSMGEKCMEEGVAEKILDEIDETRKADINIKEFKGNTAFKGKARGKVRLINFIKDTEDLAEGEILVASMTDPRYVPAMKKAVAFITDEGGITCHAAIVAREMKKPCVIGTKIATSILKDGDEVEVDAEKGIIKKLN